MAKDDGSPVLNDQNEYRKRVPVRLHQISVIAKHRAPRPVK